MLKCTQWGQDNGSNTIRGFVQLFEKIHAFFSGGAEEGMGVFVYVARVMHAVY